MNSGFTYFFSFSKSIISSELGLVNCKAKPAEKMQPEAFQSKENSNDDAKTFIFCSGSVNYICRWEQIYAWRRSPEKSMTCI